MVQEAKKKRFVVTEKGEKTDIILSLKEYQELMEDLEDLAIVAERKNEPTMPFSEAKARLERKWRHTGSK